MATTSIYHEMISEDKSNHTESNGKSNVKRISESTTAGAVQLTIWTKEREREREREREVKKQGRLGWSSRFNLIFLVISFSSPLRMGRENKTKENNTIHAAYDEPGNHLKHQGNHHLTDHRILLLLSNTSASLTVDSQINHTTVQAALAFRWSAKWLPCHNTSYYISI